MPGTPPRARESSPRASVLSLDRRWSMRRARSLATRRTLPRAYRRRPSRARCSSPETCSAKSPVYSSLRSRALKTQEARPLPISLYRIVRASGGAWRGGARALTPFIGREEELGLLTRRWERARAGEGQVVQIVGEPGIGKSRLLDEFRAKLGETPHTWAVWSASQLLKNTPLHPIAEWGRFRFGGDLPPEQRLADLEGTLRLIGLDPVEVCAADRATGGHPASAGQPAKFLAGRDTAAATDGDRRVCAGRRALSASRPCLRGSAMGRPDLARTHARARRARSAGAACSSSLPCGRSSTRLGACDRTTA